MMSLGIKPTEIVAINGCKKLFFLTARIKKPVTLFLAWGLVCVLICASMLASAAEKTNDEVFNEAKTWGKAQSTAPKGYIQNNEIKNTVPGYPTSNPWQGELYQGGFGNTKASGAMVATDCKNNPLKSDSKDTEQCNALNLLQHAAGTNNPYTITQNDPMIVNTRPIINNPSSGSGGLPFNGQYGDCKDKPINIPEKREEFKCEIYSKIDESSCVVGTQLVFDKNTRYQCDQTVQTIKRESCQKTLTIEMKPCLPNQPTMGQVSGDGGYSLLKNQLDTQMKIKDDCYTMNNSWGNGIYCWQPNKFCDTYPTGIRFIDTGNGRYRSTYSRLCLSLSGQDSGRNSMTLTVPTPWNGTFSLSGTSPVIKPTPCSAGVSSLCRPQYVWKHTAKILITAAPGSQLYLNLTQVRGGAITPAINKPLYRITNLANNFEAGQRFIVLGIKQPRCASYKSVENQYACTMVTHNVWGLFVFNETNFDYVGHYNNSVLTNCINVSNICALSRALTEQDRPFIVGLDKTYLLNTVIPLVAGKTNEIEVETYAEKNNVSYTFNLTGKCANDTWTGCATLEGASQ